MKKAIPFLLLLAACGKDDDVADTQAPTVVINTPAANGIVSGGQQVSVNAAITDDIRLKRIHLEVINTTTGLVVAHEHYPTTATTYTLNERFTAQTANTYRIKVEADDTKGNIGSAEVSITAN